MGGQAFEPKVEIWGGVERARANENEARVGRGCSPQEKGAKY